MLKLIKRSILKGIEASGYTVIKGSYHELEKKILIDNQKLSPADANLRMTKKLVPVGQPAAVSLREQLSDDAPPPGANKLTEVDDLLRTITPWSGKVPKGFTVDFLGVLLDSKFRLGVADASDERYVQTNHPTLADYGEGWFEAADWIYSAREARDRYVAISLGACFGYQLVGAWKVLQAVNPLPACLVAVEADPENCDWIRQYMTDNGIDPNDHWIIQSAVGPDNEPVLFPTGSPGSGRGNCVMTNSAMERQKFADRVRKKGESERIFQNILLFNSTGAIQDLGAGFEGQLKFVSAVTLRDVLAPFDRVDLLEVDIQQSEVNAFSPYMDVVGRKVRRVHVGTHGSESHRLMRALFLQAGWDIVFDYAPDGRCVTELGPLVLTDGILTARNPRV